VKQRRVVAGLAAVTAIAALQAVPARGQVLVGSEFQVNFFTTSAQTSPGVASDASGNFLVVWQSNLQDGSTWGVFGRRYDATGTPQGGEFEVNSNTTDFQYRPRVASDATGDFVVVWQSYLQDGSSSGVFGQRYDATGTPQGVEFQVNSSTTANQTSPSVASAATGN
jgi:hypothetical protein